MNGPLEIGDISPFRYFLCAAVVLGLLFLFVSPDEAGPFGWFGHVIQWQIQTTVPMLMAIVSHLWLSKVPAFRIVKPWLSLTLSGLVSACVATPFALLSDVVFAGETISEALTVELLSEFIAIAPPIIVFWVVINVPFQLGWRLVNNANYSGNTVNEARLDESSTLQQSEPSFLSQTDRPLRGELVYLRSELHYLRVVTERDEALILHSLAAAIDALSIEGGLQTHRSYWLNTRFVAKLISHGRGALAVLDNGEKIPVSRRRLKAVKAQIGQNNARKSPPTIN